MNDISVVLCTYNGERFIKEQLRSIVGQTRLPSEVVIGDDGSTDATLDIVAAVAATTPVPVHVHRNPTNLGFAENFLQAAARATGRYIAFSDQDDRWAPQKLERTLDALLRHGAVLCTHGVELIDQQGTPIDSRRAPVTTHVVEPLRPDPWGNFYGFTMLLDRALLERIPAELRGADPHEQGATLSHDRWVYFLATTFGRTVVLGDRLAAYRQHDRQIYGGTRARTLRERLETKVATGLDQARYLATVAAHRAELLESRMPPEPRAQLWRTGAGYWRTVEAHLNNRAQLYEPMASAERLARLVVNVRGGMYRAYPQSGLGARRFAEDVAVTAAMGGLQALVRTGDRPV